MTSVLRGSRALDLTGKYILGAQPRSRKRKESTYTRGHRALNPIASLIWRGFWAQRDLVQVPHRTPPALQSEDSWLAGWLPPGRQGPDPHLPSSTTRYWLSAPSVTPPQFSSYQSLSHVQFFATPWTAPRQASLSITNSWSLPKLIEFNNPLSLWWHPTISSSVIPFSSCSQSFPASESFLMSQCIHIRCPKYWSFSFNISPSNEHQDWFPLDGLVGSPCSPKDSQESSPAPQFKSINSSALSFLYSPILTSIHDYRINHSLDSMDLCWQSNVSAF